MISKQCCSRLQYLQRGLASSRSFSTSRQLKADHVRIVEVGPRDGLQNEKPSIPVPVKIELVRRLAETGLRTIEAGSFVHPKWVPQMANSSEILQHVLQTPPPSSSGPIAYQWLLPNVKGLENYLKIVDSAQPSPSSASPSSSNPSSNKTSTPPFQTDTGPALNTSSYDANAMPSSTSAVEAMAKNRASTTSSTSSSNQPNTQEISIFMAATETFSQKNTNCDIATSLSRFEPLIKSARSRSIPVRAYISVALGCPYEGPDVSPSIVADLAVKLLEMGCYEVSVADTTGMGTVDRTATLLRTLSAAGILNEKLALHFHDTYGQALANAMVGLEHGVRTYDSAVGGLGGCPFSPGATGNVSTEDFVRLVHGTGMTTGVDLEKLAEVGEWISAQLGRRNDSRAGKAVLAQKRIREKNAE